MTQSRNIRRLCSAAFFLTVANFAGKLLGFLRDILISYYFGATAQTDAFFLALSIPTILVGVFTSSADSAIVPQYNRITERVEGRQQADLYFSNILTLLTVIATLAGGISLLFPKYIVLLFAPTFRGEILVQACSFLRIFSFAGLFHIWYCFFCSYLLCYEKTTVRMILSLTTNVFVVLALLFIHDTKMYALGGAYLMGAAFNAILPILAARQAGYRYHFAISLKKYDFPDFLKLFLPIMGSAFLADLLLFTDRFLSSFLQVGSLSTLNYASKIINIFDNILVVGVGAILLPILTRLQINKQADKFRFTTSAVCFCSILTLCPIAILCILYSHDLVTILYLRGAFTMENVRNVSVAFQAYGMQILLLPLQTILVKTFHAMANTRKPFHITLMTFVLNIVLSFTLMQWFGVFGIALATSLSTLAGCVLLIYYLSKTAGLHQAFFGVSHGIRLLFCILVLALPSKIFPAMSSSWGNLLLSGGSSFCLYAGIVLVLFRKELVQCKNAILG